ncbi:growth hormone releasing hormone receptor, like [Hypanus sabinus]|uniref:growth hormone releasing hormone receptor, like n=1 Tax=Hypanus sabinus TaxID=79690 RepID=UPI0028C5035A|nr:growth hormone releasing hormone receptor, like [Hypanus sabinus]
MAKLHPECDLVLEIKREKDECIRRIREIRNTSVSGCRMVWEYGLCWPNAEDGETVNVSCPKVFLNFSPVLGVLNRNCTSEGWSDALPPDIMFCMTTETTHNEEVSYFSTIRVIYTVGYSLSLIVLTIAVITLLAFQNLHCTRNYIHIQLFITFILRSFSVIIKDAVLFGDNDIDHCSFSTVGCKIAVVFCYFSMMTNYFWLLVEALYLNSLLLASFSYVRSSIWWWSLLGWGVPTISMLAWVITKIQFENTECWDIIDGSPYWWIIKGPIVASVAINFVLFMNIVRILVQKLIPGEMRLANSSQYRRLTKSTLLLIPLFGIHYIICAFPPDGAVMAVRLYLELCIGSFQGLTVGILYCFLNQEVQTEIYRRWLRRQMDSYVAVPVIGRSLMDTSC